MKNVDKYYYSKLFSRDHLAKLVQLKYAGEIVDLIQT